MGVSDYSKQQSKLFKVPHSKSADLNRIQVTTLTCCNLQVKQHYFTMLATATSNCAVTMMISIMSSREQFISRYLRRRQWIRHQIDVMCPHCLLVP